MNRKFIYPLLLILTMAIIYWAEEKLNTSVKENSVEKNKQSSMLVDTSLLPTSTTGEIVYHEYYTLSYSEPDEQAEWVAYELTKEQLKGDSYKRPYFEIDPDVSTGAAGVSTFIGTNL